MAIFLLMILLIVIGFSGWVESFNYVDIKYMFNAFLLIVSVLTLLIGVILIFIKPRVKLLGQALLLMVKVVQLVILVQKICRIFLFFLPILIGLLRLFEI